MESSGQGQPPGLINKLNVLKTLQAKWMKTEFKFMQLVAVSDTSEDCAIEGLITNTCDYYYLFTDNEGKYCTRWVHKANGNEGVYNYEYVVAIPLVNEELHDRLFEGINLCDRLTKREYFAAAALQGLLANTVMGDADLHDTPKAWRKDMSESAVEFADAVLGIIDAA